jgi:DNA (cytosine-5)-methyltransferase 1
MEEMSTHAPGFQEIVGQPRSPRRRLPFKVVGLFAGVGGLETGLARSGHETRLLCEIEPGAVAVLKARHPGVPIHKDVRTLKALPKETELVVGGFPCQDLSQAGKTAGISGSQSGLVGEVFRLLRRQRVPWLLLENVPFMLQLARGRALAVIIAELESLGYRWAYRVVNTRAFGLPQRRERVLIVAALDEDPRDVLFADETGAPTDEANSWTLANGFYWTEGVRGLGWATNAIPTLKGGSTIGIPSPPAIVLPSGEIVTPDLRDAERLQGFPPEWTEPAESVSKRSHRWKLVGNAVTVDVAQWIGECLRLPSSKGRDVEGTPLRPEAAWPKSAWNVGEGRFRALLSSWPVRREGLDLHKFLQYPPAPLSMKATAGFLSRAESSTLRFPDGFLDRLKNHLRIMERLPSRPVRRVVEATQIA